MSDLPPLPETPTGRYRHYKGGQYEVIGVARHSETLEPLVIYRPLDNASGLWVRAHAMFFGAVEVDGQRQPRFACADAAPAGAADLVHRALTGADAPAFSALRREVVADFPLGMGLTLQEELGRPLAGFAEQLSAPAPNAVFGAFAEGRLVATSGIAWPSKFASGAHKSVLWGVFTAPAFRRRSLARALVLQAIGHAFAHDARRIYLSVYVPNPAAVRLYESLGFTTSGREPEVLRLGETYHDIQYMSLKNPAARD